MRSLRRIRRALPLLLPPGGVAIAVVTDNVVAVLTLGAALILAHGFTIPDRGGRRLSLSPMVAVAALLLTEGTLSIVFPGAMVGMPIGWWLVRLMRGERSLDHVFPSEPIALATAAGCYSGVQVLLSQGSATGDLGHAIAIGVASLGWYFAAAIVRMISEGSRHRTAWRVLAWQALRDGPAYTALFSSGAMFGFAWEAMGLWAFPVTLLLYGFSHLSLHRVATTTRTYRQTITALGRIPEAGGLVGHGRAERTGALAAAVAGEMRLPPPEVERAEYAGLLHDVGRVVFNDPTVAEGGYSETDVAAWGAAIIQESPFLTEVGQLVADQCKPYRRAGEVRNELVPRSAQVVRISAVYDRTLHEEGQTVVEALEELHRGAAYEYDPEVVAALRRVLQRKGVPGA